MCRTGAGGARTLATRLLDTLGRLGRAATRDRPGPRAPARGVRPRRPAGAPVKFKLNIVGCAAASVPSSVRPVLRRISAYPL